MLSSRQRRSDPEHFLAFTSIFKNENTYLGEWLEYHRIVGVDHFYLYDDDGSPEARELLQPYIELQKSGGVQTTSMQVDWVKVSWDRT